MAVKMYVQIECIGPYKLRCPLSGGKAGKGRAKTSNVQVFNTNSGMIEKQCLFTVGDPLSKAAAIEKAKAYCLTQNES